MLLEKHGAKFTKLVVFAGCTGVDGSTEVTTQASTQTATESIKPAELAGLPPIVVVWAKAGRVRGTDAGDRIVVRGDGTHPREVVSWHSRYWPDGSPFGVYAANWSPDLKSIGVALAVWLDDPADQVAIISPNNGKIGRLTKGHDSHFYEWSADGKRLLYTTGGLGNGPPALRSVLVGGYKTAPVKS